MAIALVKEKSRNLNTCRIETSEPIVKKTAKGDDVSVEPLYKIWGKSAGWSFWKIHVKCRSI